VGKFIRRLARDQNGSALIEYTVLVAIMAALVFGTMKFVGADLHGRAQGIIRCLDAASQNISACSE
jgi:Flp pilus assembly pilin Flp